MCLWCLEITFFFVVVISNFKLIFCDSPNLHACAFFSVQKFPKKIDQSTPSIFNLLLISSNFFIGRKIWVIKVDSLELWYHLALLPPYFFYFEVFSHSHPKKYEYHQKMKGKERTCLFRKIINIQQVFFLTSTSLRGFVIAH